MPIDHEPPYTRPAKPADFGFALTVVIATYAAVVYWVVTPVHAGGWLQSPAGFMIGLDHVLQRPGFTLSDSLGLRAHGHTSHLAWLWAWAVNLVFYFLAGMLIGATRRQAPSMTGRRDDGMTKSSVASGSANHPVIPSSDHLPVVQRVEPSGLERRQFLGAGVRLTAGAAAATFGYALFAEPRWFRITRRRIAVRSLPAALNGLRAVQLTDIHHGPWLSLAYVREVVSAANDVEPDLVLLTGDYVLASAAYIRPVIAELSRLRPKVATLAVLGNHDWWEDAALTRQELRRAGIPAIDNGRRVVTPGRKLVEHAAWGLAICGVGDLWEDRPDYAGALSGLPADMPRLLLSHNPDVAEEPEFIHGSFRVDLMLSGHTHGGQIHIPTLGPPLIPSRYGQKYAQGLVQGPVCPVFVSRGIGVSKLPLRIGVPPEIAVLEFQPA